MPTELASEMAIYEADEQARQANQAKYFADFLASQPGPRNVPSGSGSQHGEEAAAQEDDDNSQERSEFLKQWKDVKISRDEVEELLKKEPNCDRCLRFRRPCNALKANLICKECQAGKVVCPRKLNSIARVLAQKLGETEEVVRSKYDRFKAPSTQKAKGKTGDGGKAKAKQSKGNLGAGKAKGKGKEKVVVEVPKIIIPGGRGGQPSGTKFDGSPSRAPCADDESEGELEMDIDVPGTLSQVSPPQPQHSNLQAQATDNPPANEEIQMAVDAPSSYTHSHSQALHVGNTRATNEDDISGEMNAGVDTRSLWTPQTSFKISRSQIPDIPLESKRKMWDDMSRVDLYGQLEACEARQTLSRQLLEDVTSAKDILADHVLKCDDDVKELRMRMKVLEDGDDDLLAKLTSEWTDQVKEAQSDAEGAIKQRREAESELSELRGRVEYLEDEKSKAWCEVEALRHELESMRAEAEQRRETEGLGDRMDVLQESQFGKGASSLPLQDQGRNEKVSSEQCSEALSTQTRLFQKETSRSEELENEVVRLRFDLVDKARLHSHLLSDYAAFAREVRMTAYALKGVEASVSQETHFSCKDFRAMINDLSAASSEAKERIGTMERGKFSIVGFIEPGDSDMGWRSPSSNQEKRDGKRKERGDDDEQTARSRRRLD